MDRDQRCNLGVEVEAVQQQHSHMPDWWYRGKCPPNDNAYFENLCRVIFQTGLNWHVVEKKWQGIKKAFFDFNVEMIAHFGDSDVERLLNNPDIIRNRYKIRAIIENAKKFLELDNQYGSFKDYLDSLDKSNNYQKVIQDLSDKLERVGPTTATLFLYSVGENINPSILY